MRYKVDLKGEGRMNEHSRQRLNRMLEADKEEMNEESKRAALRDFARVAAEYFEVDGDVSLRAEQTGHGTQVAVCFHALRVKNFSLLK